MRPVPDILVAQLQEQCGGFRLIGEGAGIVGRATDAAARKVGLKVAGMGATAVASAAAGPLAVLGYASLIYDVARLGGKGVASRNQLCKRGVYFHAGYN